MRKTWIAAVLLASAIAVPAYAQDQDHGGHDGGGHHQDGGQHGGGQGGGQHQGGGERQGGNPGGGQAQHFQPPQQDRGQAAAVAGARAGHDVGAGQGWQGRPGGRDDQGRPVLNGVPHGNYGQRPDGQPGGRNDGRPNISQGWNGGRPDGGHGGNDGRPDRGNWNGGRPDNGWNGGRPDQRHDWNGGRPNNGHGWNGGDRGGGGDWNRGWRQDNRYNWQGWRSQHREIYRAGRYRAPYGGYGYRSFAIGSAIDSIFYAQNYWIGNPEYYRLPPAYGPYRWVRYYNDALLVDVEDGEVVDAIPNFFY